MRHTTRPQRAGPPRHHRSWGGYLGGDRAGADYWLVGAADIYRTMEPHPAGKAPHARHLCSFSSPNRGVR